MQDSKTNKYEENFRILLAILLSAAIGFGMGCYTGSKMEQKHEQSFYNQYIKPVSDSEHELIQNLGNDLKRCQDNLTEYRKVTMTSNAAQYDSMVVAVKEKFTDFEARHEELAKAKEALAEARKKAKK